MTSLILESNVINNCFAFQNLLYTLILIQGIYNLPVKTFKVEKKNSGEHLKDDKQLALPPRRPKHGLRFLNSTAPARSRVSAQLSS